MYTNENRFSFRNVIFQFLFVALFVFILLCLFPTKDYVNDVKSELLAESGESTSQDKTSTLVTSAIFNQNITTMKEASITYFTIPRLPQKKGDSVKLTLEEMLKEHLLVSPLDEEGNICDVEKSYVEITKDSEEFILKVNLKCGSEEDYILVHLGCYDYCQGTVCESKTTPTATPQKDPTSKPDPKPIPTPKPDPKPPISYQYEYKLNGKWSNWSNWSNWSKEKVTSSTSKEVESEERIEGGKVETIAATKEVSYTCPSGYNPSATDQKKCIKIASQKVTARVTKKYSCPSGFTYSGGMCKKGYRKTVDAKRKVTYTCPKGYIISGDTCYKQTTTTIDATKIIKYSCEEGYTIHGTSCTRTVTTVTRQTFTSARSGSNYKLVSVDTRPACTGCEAITYWTYDVTTTETKTKAAHVDINYICPNSNYKLVNTSKCVKVEDTTKPPTATYGDWYCEKGYDIDGKKCIKDVITELHPDVSIHYSCEKEKGYDLIEGVCVRHYIDTRDKIAKYTYKCPSNEYTFHEENKTCSIVVQGQKVRYYRYRTRTYLPGDTQWRDTKTDHTLLSKGYYLTGNKRIKSTK